MDKGIAMAGWLSVFISTLLAMSAQVRGDKLINITFMESAIPKGAGSI